ncbi:MAG: hypothetical protein WBW16_11575 [Bacteroidota bacterium]
MLRFLLWLLFFYFLYRLLRLLIPVVQQAWRSGTQKVGQSAPRNSEKPRVDFSNIKDAEFEELPNDASKKTDEKQS